MRSLAAREVGAVAEWLLRSQPGHLGRLARRAYWRRRLARVGERVVIGENVRIFGAEYVEIGDNCWIDDNVTLIAGPVSPRGRRVVELDSGSGVARGRLEIGSRVHIAVGALIQAHGGVSVGDDLTIAAGARVFSMSHHHRDPSNTADDTMYSFGTCAPAQRQCLIVGNVMIEGESAVGANAVVLPGSRLAMHAWLGAGSVFRGASERGQILVGNPAVVVRNRYDARGHAGT